MMYRYWQNKYLLLGGDKNSQNKDIQKSINLWEEYKNEIERYFRDI